MTNRDPQGRFVSGNACASDGGNARASALTPEQRSHIARQGGQAAVRTLAAKHFDGDLARTRRYMADWLAYINDPYRRTPLGRFPYPGGPLPPKPR